MSFVDPDLDQECLAYKSPTRHKLDLYVRRKAEMEALYPEWATATHLERKVMSQEKLIEGDPLAKQIGGSHYKTMKIQPIEYITANNMGFIEGNIIKYITRHHAKNGADDVRKVIHYCELLLATKYGDNS